jgi:hypothetical protein
MLQGGPEIVGLVRGDAKGYVIGGLLRAQRDGDGETKSGQARDRPQHWKVGCMDIQEW